MSVKAHYENLLGPVYSWLSGPLLQQSAVFEKWCIDHGVPPGKGHSALDLGSAHGIQTVALARHGYNVTAFDLSDLLLQQLEANCSGLPVRTVLADMCEFASHIRTSPHVIVCWGDTLTHLDSEGDAVKLLELCATRLAGGGMLLLAFRDYTRDATGARKIIPVKNDNVRILTCVLDYREKHVEVTDILHTSAEESWLTESSSYRKIRLAPSAVTDALRNAGLTITSHTTFQGMESIVAKKLAV